MIFGSINVSFPIYLLFPKDPDKSGYIEQNELRASLRGICDESEIGEMLKQADSHCTPDGRMSKKEFLEFIKDHENWVASNWA